MSVVRALATALLFLSIGGCEAVFTASPLRFLARDPANLPPAIRVQYARDALLSGNGELMASAYGLMAGLCAAEPGNPEYLSLAGRLGVEVSGVGAVVDALLRGEIQIFGESALIRIEESVAAAIADPQLAGEAGGYLEAAAAAGADLVGADYLTGAFCLFVVACTEAGGYGMLDQPGSWSDAARAAAQRSVDLLSLALALYPAGDPATVFIGGFLTFYDGFAGGTP